MYNEVMDDDLPKRVIDIPLPPPTENIGKKIVMFGSPTCPDCARIKRFFSDNAIEYEYFDISTDKNARKWVASFSEFVPVLLLLDGEVLYSPSNDQLLEKIQQKSVNGKVSASLEQVFDTIIIGGGPAGLSAAIYAVRKALNVLLITKTIGGQAALSGDIENYLGFSMITGADLADKFRQEVERFSGHGLWVKEGVEVKGIEGKEDDFKVITDANNSYSAKTIIIASGRKPRLLGIPGEKELFGKGVAVCATCDAPLYRGKDVAVVGGGNSALDATQALMKFAKSVVIINNTDELRGDQVMLERVKNSSNVTVYNGATALEIKGKNLVEGIKIKTNEGEKDLNLAGVFIEIGWIPANDFVPPEVDKNERGEIIVDELGKTSFDGIWAAGDVNNLWGEQIIIAAGEGAKVALSVAEHIAKIPHQATSNTHMG